MMKKLLLGLVALIAIFAIAGCGTEKPKDTADKAVDEDGGVWEVQ